MAGMNDKSARRQGGASKLLASTAAVTEKGIVDPAAGASPVVIDPPIPAADVVPAPPAGSEPDNAAVLLDPTLTGEPDAPQPIVSAAPVLAMEPSAVDVVQAEAKAERIDAGIEPGATGDAALDAVAAQPTIAIERGAFERVASDAGTRSAVNDGVLPGVNRHPDDAMRSRQGTSITKEEMFAMRGIPPLSVIADVLEHLAVHDPEALDYLGERYFSGGARSSANRQAVTEADTVTVVSVSGPPQGRRRAGISFGTSPRLFLASYLPMGAIDALRADPALAVSMTEMDQGQVGLTTFDAYPAVGL